MMAKRKNILAAMKATFVVIVAATACSSTTKSAPADDGGGAFANTIEPIVREKCQLCHREGGIAPFSLVTYEDVKSMGFASKEKVSKREMPPWGPFDEGDCKMSQRFQADLSLTQEQIDTFVGWVDRGMPRGDTSKIPQAAVEARPTGLVDKTSSYELGAKYVVPAGGQDDLRCFPLDPGFTKDTWIEKSIVVPADARTVHHVLVYVDPQREGMTKVGSGDSYPCFSGSELQEASLLLAWSPGGTPTAYGENTGLLVPKGAHIVMQVHYHPIAEATTGRTNLELKALPKKPAHSAEFLLIGNADRTTSIVKLLPGPDDPPDGPDFLIPSNAKGHTEAMEYVMPYPQRRLSVVGAHMHWAGVGLKLEVEREATLKGKKGPTECLLNTTYDFNWQRTYNYAAPLSKDPILYQGDKLRVTCTYDNSEDNQHIERVTKELRMTKPPDIRLGAKSTDEMCQAIVVFVD